MKNMKKVLSLILALAMVFSLAACGGSTAETGSGDAEEAAATEEVVATNDSEPAYGGEVTLYYPKFYNFFDPAMINEYQYSFWFETLWTIDLTKSAEYSFDACATPVEDMTGQIAVDMGEMNYETGELTVTLRDDVYFQDKEPYNGRALTADDVVWSYSRLLGLNGLEKVVIEDSPSDWATTLYMLEAVEAKDEHTVVFTLGENYRNEVGYAAFVNVKVNIGGTEWDDLTDEQKSDWNYAAGTGPYILTEYVADNSMKLEKNDNYYDYDDRYPENKLPYIDVINLIYLEDTANVLAQAMAGSLDWFGENGKNVLDNTQLAQLADAATGYTQEYLSGSPVAIGLKVSQDQFSDVKVREAMQHAIDIEGISQVYFNIAPEDLVIPGLWSPSLNGWSTVGSWSEDLSSQFTYDPELAKELLAEAGYPDGFTFTIQLDPTANMSIYEEAKTELAAVGITMEIEVASEMMEAVSVSQDPTDERQFNTFGGGYSAVSLANMMVGDNSAQLQVETNGFNHDNQEVFDLLAQIQSATTVDEQASIAQQLDQIFPENHWAIDLTGVQPTYDWISSRIGGYSGEKVYYDNNMRTIWSRLWVSE
ncbi:MAG: ABC transporter substrate-binding protein [Eubacterium sp.]|nr:ABC transporter substrate-binding protein [Eubacterium sp.]